MKKIAKILSATVLFVTMISSYALAETAKIVVKSLNDFSSQNPSTHIAVQVEDNYKMPNGEILPKGIIFNGEVIDIIQPKRGKRDGYIYYKLTEYKYNNSGFIKIKNENLIAKVKEYSELDLKETAISAGTSVAGLFVEHISYPINFARGVISPYEDTSRLKSGLKKTYEKSMFSYISKGDCMEFKNGDKIILIFKYHEE